MIITEGVLNFDFRTDDGSLLNKYYGWFIVIIFVKSQKASKRLILFILINLNAVLG